MRRTLAAATVALAAVVATVPAATGSGSSSASGGDPSPAGRQLVAEPAEHTLTKARRLLAATGTSTAVEPQHATAIFRELFENLPELEGEDRVEAQRLLARPTDGASDPRNYGYTTGSVKSCKGKVCVHWVRSTADAPPSDAWSKKALNMLHRVYAFEVGKLGFRRPVTDGRHGGNSKFDVYLKDLDTGLYGYCAPEYYKPGSRSVASSYCVVDNDFAETEFRGRPADNLKVTLAHEFFHAVQYAYDITDDPWLYESTAVWMEERFADDINDNRQYLPVGQIRLSHIPLDTWAAPGGPGIHYGNWVWWEYLSSRFGKGIVRAVWSRLDANRDKPDMYSTQGLKSVLKGKGGFRKVFTAYAGGNNLPAKSYAEGEHWPAPILSGGHVLGKGDRKARFRSVVDHMASRNYVVKPDSSLRGGWRLRIKVNAPGRSSAPGVYLIVRKTGGQVERRAMTLSRKGFGKVVLAFDSRRTASVSITVANASTRFRCGRDTSMSCRGVARDDGRRFTIAASAFR